MGVLNKLSNYLQSPTIPLGFLSKNSMTPQLMLDTIDNYMKAAYPSEEDLKGKSKEEVEEIFKMAYMHTTPLEARVKKGLQEFDYCLIFHFISFHFSFFILDLNRNSNYNLRITVKVQELIFQYLHI